MIRYLNFIFKYIAVSISWSDQASVARRKNSAEKTFIYILIYLYRYYYPIHLITGNYDCLQS